MNVHRPPADAAHTGALDSVPGLADLPEADRRRLEAKAERQRIPRGTLLVRQGDPSDELYIVLSGRFFVTLDGRPGAIAEIGPGEPVGELAFFGAGGRTANVVAARDSEVLLLTREAYRDVVQDVPGIVSGILASVAKRLAAATPSAPVLRAKPARTIALFPIGANGELPEGFVEKLERALGRRNVAIVSRKTMPDLGDERGLARFLAHVEERADLVLFAVERDSPATSLCLNFADDLILVAPSEDREARAAGPTDAERGASELFMREHRALILWRENADVPIAGTEAWLEDRDIALHHHLALDRPADFERIARFLTGDAVGLVLSGGGVFGCAHLGIAKALKDAGIPIDFAGGSSVGAAMAAGLSAGLDPDEILDRTEESFIKNRAMRRVTIPIHSILDHRAYDAALQRNYGARRIEDLPVNWFAVSASLTHNRMRIHRSGLLWEAVRASTAIPGILPPFITKEGDMLVDGALVDNVPVNVMRALKLGPNVVVLFRRPGEARVAGGYASTPSRGALLRNLIFRRRRSDYPSMLSIIMRGMFLSSDSIQRMSSPGDLFVTPGFAPDIRLLDWRRGREIAAAAHTHMCEVLTREGGRFSRPD